MLPDGVTAAVRLTNVLLLCGFIANLLILRFRAGRKSAFLLPWLLFWATFLVETLAGWFPIEGLLTFDLFITILGAINIVNSFFLFLSSEFLGSSCGVEVPTTKLRPLFKWAVPCGVALVGLPAMTRPFQELVSNAVGFLALAVYAGRYGEVVKRSSGWVSVLLYIYAGTFLVYFSRAGEPALLMALWVASVPLKVILYYTGYVELSRSSRHTPSPVSSPSKRSQPPSQQKPAAVLPPEPNVTVEFTGFWGFLYILWRYPSGKAVVVFILASLVSAFGFIASNLQAFVKALAEGITR